MSKPIENNLVVLLAPDRIHIGVDGEFADYHNFMQVAEVSVHSLIGVETAKANANKLVKSWNAYDVLVDALKRLMNEHANGDDHKAFDNAVKVLAAVEATNA